MRSACDEVSMCVCVCVYIYIYMDWVQIIPDVTLSNITPPTTCYRIHILKITSLNYMF